MSKATIAKAIRDLEEKGFIERTRYGGLYKQTNLYAISGNWINWRQKKENASAEIELNRYKK
ncbi:hypothetical protein [Mariprofundus ferrooxydans]|uniref:hypothetical protein n=1 Tax=Mariprofundus ferrooxydans TaxID=314344 RepID=UPI001430B5FE|nr:hypothetical protein [Mariprofundus ferrooxydans]